MYIIFGFGDDILIVKFFKLSIIFGIFFKILGIVENLCNILLILIVVIVVLGSDDKSVFLSVFLIVIL